MEQGIDTSEEAPRPAATVVLLRDSAMGPQVLLTLRPRTLRFMGGAVVFPGGAIDPADADPHWIGASKLSPTDAAAALGILDPNEALAYYVCALREAFEEVGLWLAGGGAVDRRAAGDPVTFRDRCLEGDVALATDRLVPAGRWVTPLGAPVRFDTRFFVAVAPEGFEPRPDPFEVAECWWSTPAAALTQAASGTALMAPPTIETLQRLDGFATVADVVEGLSTSAREEARIIGTRLSPFVYVVVAPNPGAMTGPGTNTYVVGAGPTIVIDPGVDETGYLDAVERAAGHVDAILITHRHSDHVGGAAELARRTGASVRAFGSDPAGGAQVQPLADGEVVVAGGARLVCLHTPGHASDHLCFLLDGAASLFSGDTVLGEGTAVIAPPDGDMRAYLNSLKRLAGLRLSRIYPGHHPPLDGGRAVIERYIAHRLERAAAIRDALQRGPMTISVIVEAVYTDTPVALHPIAEYSVLAHLEMMVEDDEVAHDGGVWRLTLPRS